jgi:hypothetical protein
MTELRYNKQCPGHEHTCWTHRNLMREDDLVCTKDYKRLPDDMKKLLWKVKSGNENTSALSIVVDWLIDNLSDDELNCEN